MKAPRISPAWLLFAAALALRAGWVVYRWTTRGPAFDYPDEDLHWQLATHLVRDGALVSDDGRFAARMPLYPLFLAVFAWLGSTGILLAKLAQACLGAATTIVGYRLARAALDQRAALVVGVLIVCDPYAVFFANLLLTEGPFTLLAVGMTACAWGVLTTPQRKAPLLGLAVLGPAAILTRPSAAALIPLTWLLIVWLAADRRAAALRLLVCPIVLVGLMLPWGLRNYAVLGSPAWLSTNGGVTLYDALGPQADGSSNQAFLQKLPDVSALGEVALDQHLRRLAVQEMWAHLDRVLRLAGVKFLRTWSLLPNVPEYRDSRVGLIGAAYTLLMLLGGVASFATGMVTHGGRRGWHVLMWLPVLYFTMLHCVYIGSVRYRVPLLPFLALAGGAVCQRPIKQHTQEIPRIEG